VNPAGVTPQVRSTGGTAVANTTWTFTTTP
jgi:hypothetical protein